jgi:Late embryogenesis abundant protein
MNHTRRALLAAPLLALACSLLKPSPPVITPRSASVTRATSAGLGLRVELSARNTARVDVTIQSIDVRLTLAGRDLGMTHIGGETRLPSNTDVPLSLEVTAPWQDLPGILLATAFNENVPYHLDGTVRVGGEHLNVDVPFQMDSTIPRSVLTGAATGSLPSVPGVR